MRSSLQQTFRFGGFLLRATMAPIYRRSLSSKELNLTEQHAVLHFTHFYALLRRMARWRVHSSQSRYPRIRSPIRHGTCHQVPCHFGKHNCSQRCTNDRLQMPDPGAFSRRRFQRVSTRKPEGEETRLSRIGGGSCSRSKGLVDRDCDERAISTQQG